MVIDVETAGFNANTDALLEIAAVTVKMDEQGILHPDLTFHYHIDPFEGANLEPAALEFNGIDPTCALRGAIEESAAMKELCKGVRKAQKTLIANAQSLWRTTPPLIRALSMPQ